MAISDIFHHFSWLNPPLGPSFLSGVCQVSTKEKKMRSVAAPLFGSKNQWGNHLEIIWHIVQISSYGCNDGSFWLQIYIMNHHDNKIVCMYIYIWSWLYLMMLPHDTPAIFFRGLVWTVFVAGCGHQPWRFRHGESWDPVDDCWLIVMVNSS